MITIDEITLPMITLTICKALAHSACKKLDNSLAKDPISTHAKCATLMLDTKDKKQISSQLSKTIASIKVQTVKEFTAASLFIMSCLSTAP
jgi:hypothetical protein